MATIYSLAHPISHEVVYVGKTNSSLEIRLYNHISSKEERPINIWIKSLKEKNLFPIISILDVCDQEISNDIKKNTLKNLVVLC